MATRAQLRSLLLPIVLIVIAITSCKAATPGGASHTLAEATGDHNASVNVQLLTVAAARRKRPSSPSPKSSPLLAPKPSPVLSPKAPKPSPVPSPKSSPLLAPRSSPVPPTVPAPYPAAQPKVGATYYVSPSGNDNNSGLSTASAWQTLYKASRAVLKPGDMLLLQGGQTFSGRLTLNQVLGSATAPIVVGSYGTGSAKIVATTAQGIFMYNCGFLEIKNLIVVGAKAQTGVEAWYDVPGLSHLYFSSLDVSSFATGIAIGSSELFRDVRVVYSRVRNNTDRGLYIGGSNRGDIADIYVGHVESYGSPGPIGYGVFLWNVKNALVERSVSHDHGSLSVNSQGFGVQRSDSVTIRYCEAYGINKTTNVDGNGFIIDEQCTNTIVEYCYAHNNAGAGFMLAQMDPGSLGAGVRMYGNIFRYNLAVNNQAGIRVYGDTATYSVSDCSVYGNTLFADRGRTFSPQAQLMPFGYINNLTCFNNLVMSQGAVPLIDSWLSTPAASVRTAGNAFWSFDSSPTTLNFRGKAYSTLSDWRSASGWETYGSQSTGIIANPLLHGTPNDAVVGIANIDSLNSYMSAWRLQATSPVISTGIDLRAAGIPSSATDMCGTALLQGSQYDAGACWH